MAIDPQNPDVVYMACGQYSWTKGDVFKFTDRGKTWVNKSATSIHHTSQPWQKAGEYQTSFCANAHTLKMNPFNNKKAIVNGEEVKLMDAPRLINERTYVALNDILKVFDATVEYDGEAKLYTVTDTNIKAE